MKRINLIHSYTCANIILVVHITSNDLQSTPDSTAFHLSINKNAYKFNHHNNGLYIYINIYRSN